MKNFHLYVNYVNESPSGYFLTNLRSSEEVQGAREPGQTRQNISLVKARANCRKLKNILEKANEDSATNPEDAQVNINAHDELKVCGRFLFDQLLGPTGIRLARIELDESESANLILHIGEDLIFIPWELLHDNKDFLGLRFNVGRIVNPGETASYHKIRLPLKMLILFNPRDSNGKAVSSCDQQATAQWETEKIQSLIHARATDRILPERRNSNTVANNELTSELLNYKIVHYCGHAKGGWILSNEMVFSCEEVARVHDGFFQNTFLVFSNACNSGTTVESGDRNDFTMAFLSKGLRHYVGTLSEIHNLASAEFAVEFYSGIVESKSIGESLTAARKWIIKQYGYGEIVWASYMLYGDPRSRIGEEISSAGAVDDFIAVQETARTYTQRKIQGLAEGDDAIYLEDAYSPRKKVEKSLERFLSSKKPGFVLVGDSGMGKTCLMCSLAKEWNNDKHYIVLFCQGRQLKYIVDPLSSLTDELMNIAGFRNLNFEDLVETIFSKSKINKELRFIMIFDAVNEYTEHDGPAALLNAIDQEIVEPYHKYWKWFKVIITCLTPSYERLHNNVTLRSDNYFESDSSSNRLPNCTLLKKITDREDREELNEMIEKYKAMFHLAGNFPPDVREYAEHPLLLRLMAKTHEGCEIPSSLYLPDIFEKYLAVKKKQTIDGLFDTFLPRLVQKMYEHKCDTIGMARLADWYAGEGALDNMQRDVKGLVNAGILRKEEREETTASTVEFTYEKVFEFLLSKFLTSEELGEKMTLNTFCDNAAIASKGDSRFESTILRGALEFVVTSKAKDGEYEFITDLLLRGENTTTEMVLRAIASLTGRQIKEVYKGVVHCAKTSSDKRKLIESFVSSPERLSAFARCAATFSNEDRDFITLVQDLLWKRAVFTQLDERANLAAYYILVLCNTSAEWTASLFDRISRMNVVRLLNLLFRDRAKELLFGVVLIAWRKYFTDTRVARGHGALDKLGCRISPTGWWRPVRCIPVRCIVLRIARWYLLGRIIRVYNRDAEKHKHITNYREFQSLLAVESKRGFLKKVSLYYTESMKSSDSIDFFDKKVISDMKKMANHENGFSSYFVRVALAIWLTRQEYFDRVMKMLEKIYKDEPSNLVAKCTVLHTLFSILEMSPMKKDLKKPEKPLLKDTDVDSVKEKLIEYAKEYLEKTRSWITMDGDTERKYKDNVLQFLILYWQMLPKDKKLTEIIANMIKTSLSVDEDPESNDYEYYVVESLCEPVALNPSSAQIALEFLEPFLKNYAKNHGSVDTNKKNREKVEKDAGLLIKGLSVIRTRAPQPFEKTVKDLKKESDSAHRDAYEELLQKTQKSVSASTRVIDMYAGYIHYYYFTLFPETRKIFGKALAKISDENVLDCREFFSIVLKEGMDYSQKRAATRCMKENTESDTGKIRE